MARHFTTRRCERLLTEDPDCGAAGGGTRPVDASEASRSTGRLWLTLFLPFAAGYFLSYLYRTANAVIGPVLAAELTLGDGALGLLTSTYFLAFGAAQLPLGMLLDRFGPRRVEAGLLLVAAVGAVVFGVSESLGGLATGRALIGLGVSACLMASFKAFAQWYPAERLASLTGWIMASGGLGALVASQPLERFVRETTWQSVVVVLAAATVAVAALLWFVVPDHVSERERADFGAQLSGVGQVFASREFWRYAPICFWFNGGFMAVQGLWASRWMAVIEGMDGPAIAVRLTWLNATILAGFLLMGALATRAVRLRFRLERVFSGAMVVAVLLFAAIIGAPAAGAWLWPVVGLCFSVAHFAYPLVAQVFPVAFAGRANTALNLLVFVGAFGLQWGLGGMVDVLRSIGWESPDAYRAAFSALALGQVVAVGWLLLSSASRAGKEPH